MEAALAKIRAAWQRGPGLAPHGGHNGPFGPRPGKETGPGSQKARERLPGQFRTLGIRVGREKGGPPGKGGRFREGLLTGGAPGLKKTPGGRILGRAFQGPKGSASFQERGQRPRLEGPEFRLGRTIFTSPGKKGRARRPESWEIGGKKAVPLGGCLRGARLGKGRVFLEFLGGGVGRGL